MKKAIITAILMAVSSITFAHGGGTDSYGCHYKRSTGVYHCH